MSAEENMALARRFMEARVVKRDLDAVDEMLAPDFVNRNKLLPGQEPDREDYLQGIAAFHAALSEGHLIIEDQVAGGDKVVTRLVVHSPHDRGELMGVAPTGRVLTNRAIVIHRIVEGKIAEEWGMGTIGATLRKQRLEQEISERERIEQELRVARTIQQASLPKEVPQPEGWQLSPFYQPAREVGGDFYDFFALEEGRVGVVVGDATGKGMPAALVAEATSNMLRAVAQALGSSSPGEVLSRVNETLLARIPPNMFVTCFYAVLDAGSASLRYANAGHDVPYLSDFIIKLIQENASGIYNATGPDYELTIGKLLEVSKHVSGSDANFRWASLEFLNQNKVEAWSDMPAWIPDDEEGAGFSRVDVSKAIAAGLRFRPLEETVRDTLAWAQTRPADHEWRAGLKAEREAELSK